MFAAIPIAAAGIVLGSRIGLVVFLLGLALFFWSAWYRARGRCLHCGRPMESTFLSYNPWRIHDFVSFCPFCGKLLDEDVDDRAA